MSKICNVLYLSLAVVVAGFLTLSTAQASPGGAPLYDCDTMDGTNVRDGEYFFLQSDCRSGDRKYCRCEMVTNPDGQPTNTNCREVIVVSSSMPSQNPTRDYSCYCTVGPGGERGMRCGIVILPSSNTTPHEVNSKSGKPLVH